MMDTTPSSTSKKQHILLTSLGMRAIDTPYEWNGQKTTASLTPLALVQLFNESQRPNRVVTVLTEDAKAKTWPIFENGICQTLGFNPKAIDIPNGNNREEIRQILKLVAEKIPEGSELTLDVTQGLRHFPFIFYALVLYLKSLRNVQIRGAYYGMIEGTPQNAPKPIIDLQPLLELPEWFYAVRMFRDLGTTSPIATLLQPLAATLREQTKQLFKAENHEAGRQHDAQAKPVEQAVDALEKQAFAYESALPLELGKASRMLIDPIRQLATRDFDAIPPLAEELTNAIASVAEKSALPKEVRIRRGNWKQGIALNKAELDRQARMIDRYLDRDQLSLAAGLMREWVISWVMLQSGQTAGWLKRDKRQPCERYLGVLGAVERDPAFNALITDEQQAFGTFWNQLANELRNALHHHAMREKALEKMPKSLESVREFWNDLKAGKIDLPQLGGGSGQVLLSPQGTRPGVLFSALQVAQPDTCLVLCSTTSASRIPEAIQHAGFQGHIEQIVLTDPHGGFAEINTAREQARLHLLRADEVIANMTGGTTLMGVIVQRLVEEAQKLDRSVRRFALIDRRPPAEQDLDPFVQGEHCWLDEERA